MKKKKLKKDQDLIIGVDPSLTNTGVVLATDKWEIVETIDTSDYLEGWHKLTADDRNSDNGQVSRLVMVSKYLEAAIKERLPRGYDGCIYVGYEHYSFDSTNRPFALGELGGALKCTLATIPCRGVEFALVPPTTLKKFAVGRGDVKDKVQIMYQAVMEGEGEIDSGTSSDICDAYFLAKFAWYRFFPEAVMEHETFKDNLRMRLELTQEGN